MKQLISIEIERELREKEVEYFKTLTADEKKELLAEHIAEIYEMFEQEAEILETHFKKVNIRYE